MDGQSADWYPDPDGRHQLRYWNGSAWTEHVSDQGQQSTDAYSGGMPTESSDWTRPDSPDDPTADVEEGGRGSFGDGVSAPLYEFQASKLKTGRWFTPNVIRVWPDRIEEYEHHVVLKKGTQAINFAQVAQVQVRRGLRWSNLRVESTGGHTITMVGMQKAECERVKTMVDDAVHRAKNPQPVVIASQNAAPAIDVADQLTKLAALRDRGVLTEEEFQAQKAKLLAQ